MPKPREPLDERLLGRVVVISPHLDDAVMSLGATMAQAVQRGAQLEIVTVFGYEPASKAPAGPWDRKSGFATEGEAAAVRRAEDQEACGILGVIPRWMNFGAEPYDRHGSDAEIVAAVSAVCSAADTVLLPGFPLAHPDHAALTLLLLRQGLNRSRIALYAEQPYSFERRMTPRGAAVAEPLRSADIGPLAWRALSVGRAQRRAKFQAVRAYQSQLRSLGLRQTGRGHLRLRFMIWHETRRGGESIAWLPARPVIA